MKRILPSVCIMMLFPLVGSGGERGRKGFSFALSERSAVSDTFTWGKQYKQGCSMKVWVSNPFFVGGWYLPADQCQSWGIGWEYPIGSCMEHDGFVWPIIGGIIDGVRRVDNLYHYRFYPEAKDSLRDRIWRTSTLDRDHDFTFDPPRLLMRPVNRRFIDDDGDGKIDEDDLDGLDNDGDWNPLTDDVGADGLPDSLEVGCDGRTYDPVTNPDPAYDNYDPGQPDICRALPNGSHPNRGDKNVYTEKNGIPDHGEPHVDEDYGAISEEDVYLSITDTFKSLDISRFDSEFVPMGIKIIQHSYSWCGDYAHAIMPIDYWFVNIGTKTIKDVYIGYFAELLVGPTFVPHYYFHDYTGYFPDLRTGYVHNVIDAGSTPAGVILLATPKPLDSLRYTWSHGVSDTNGYNWNDSMAYSVLSCEYFGYPNCIELSESPTGPGDNIFFSSLGPFATMNPGDSLKMTIALLSGDVLDYGPNNLRENAKKALIFYSRGYDPPVEIPPPPLKITEGFKKVTLEWGHHICPACPDPTQAWDDSSRVAESDPERRKNPPSGHKHGGRIFEGYRLYRSEDEGYSPPVSSFTLLKEFDMAGDTYEYNVGIDTVFVDSNLVRGKRYWYAVTAFGIPNFTVLDIPDRSGHIHKDTVSLYIGGGETNLRSNAKSVLLPFSVSNKLGDVLVVPNPYRVDQDYTYENGGWEGRSSDWSENKRLIKFIHLPPRCTIRIYTLAGEVVTTLEHDDPVRGELSWNLLSESNRALASGVYVFTVESDFGKQIGKFVIIR